MIVLIVEEKKLFIVCKERHNIVKRVDFVDEIDLLSWTTLTISTTLSRSCHWFRLSKSMKMKYFLCNLERNINVFTSMTFLKANQNYHSRMFFENNQNFKVKSKFAKDNVKHLQKFLNVFRVNLIDAQIKQTKY